MRNNYKLKQNISKNKIVVILGPTASGKSDLAIKLARRFNGEIVCADSRQIYAEMPIGTASPPLVRPVKVFTGLTRQSPRGTIPRKITRKAHGGRSPVVFNGVAHHLFGVVSPNKPLNVASYKKMAEKTIKDIQKQGRTPFLVGGTGLYIKAIVDNLQFPKIKPSAKMRKKLEQKTATELFAIYKKIDPKGALQIDKNNKRRLIRAIEVCKITGEPFWAQRQKAAPLFDILQIGINPPKAELEKKIKKRTDRMFKQGLEKEVKKLVKKYGWNRVLQNTIGYSEYKEIPSLYGTRSEPPYNLCKKTEKELREIISLHTIQYAKRQMTWFKKDKKIAWVKRLSQAKKVIASFLNQKKTNH